MMRTILFRLSGLTLLLSILIITGCGEDDPFGTNPNPAGPFISLVAESGFISDNTTVGPGQEFKVKLRAQTGDAQLNTLTITENGTTLNDFNRISILANGTTDVTNNPLVILNNFKDGVTWEVTIQAPTDANQVFTYNFSVADDGNLSDNLSIDITVGSLGISLVQEAPYISADATFDDATEFEVKLNLTRGSFPLQTIGVYEDGTPVDPSRVKWAGTTFAKNPEEITFADKDGFESVFSVLSHNNGTSAYRFEVVDENFNPASVVINITVNGGTPVDDEFIAVMVNNADGPKESFGGLDLHTGNAVPRDSVVAEIRDMGIDINLPSAQNWLQMIRPVNDAELRIPDLTQSENFSYEAADTKEIIIAAFESGIPLSQSEKVIVGDEFLVKKGNDYFLLKVTNVSITANDNADFYEFSIKQALEL